MRKVLVCLCLYFGVFRTASASAQTLNSEKGWLDVNFGVAAAAEDSIDTLYTQPQFGETASYLVGYQFPTGASFDFGGGFMLNPVIGIGVSISGIATKSVANLGVRIPHPIRANAFATDATTTDAELERTEGTIHLQAMIKAPIANDRVRVRFFAGPSYFRLKGDAVDTILYNQVFQVLGTANSVAITTYDTTEIEQTAWGFHAGGDVAFMFGRVFGIGGFARFARGTATVDDPNVLANEPVDVKLGGFQTGGGIRLRF